MKRAVLLTVAMVVGLLHLPGGAQADGPVPVPNPEVIGPIGDAGLWGHALWDSWFDLTELGYTEDEYFVSGDARHPGDLEQTAPYTTRIIVSRPIEEDDFNGTVLLDWVNVTAQFENAVDTIEAHEMLVRSGFAYVHVSAQAAGICCSPLTPQVWDPVRYADLDHPGDDYSFDILSQVAQALREPGEIDPMDGLGVERVLAAGQSQSGGRLSSYIRNGMHAKAEVIDGFLIHGSSAGNKDYNTTVPVLHLLSDAEASPSEPDPDDPNYRLWEVAGSSHSDFWIYHHQEMGQGPRALLHAPKRPVSDLEDLRVVAGNYGEQIQHRSATCIVGGSLFPTRYKTSAALWHLNEWARTGDPAPEGPRFEFTAEGQLARDVYGNALGGIRLPPVEVPVASYVSTVCALGGKTVPFPEPLLLLTYGSHAGYYAEMEEATAAAVGDGFLLADDAADQLARACAAANRFGELSGDC